MILPITSVATVVLAAWYIILTMRVIDARRLAGVSLGDGGNELLIRRGRGQGNFVENVPITLLLLAVTEMQSVGILSNLFPIALALTTSAFVLGRLMHGYAFCFTEHSKFGRMGGMILTFVAQIALVILAAFALVF